MSEAFTEITSRAAPLMIDDVDTDMIFPARFAKTTSDNGLGDCLFANLRFHQGQVNESFVLNDPKYKDARILISGENFGCGSSREHAVWAIRDFGFRAILATSFAEIFYQNCFKNGVLPVVLAQEEIALLSRSVMQDPATPISVDLNTSVVRGVGQTFAFVTDPYRRDLLLRGVDEVGLTLERGGEIADFARRHFEKYPWINLRQA